MPANSREENVTELAAEEAEREVLSTRPFPEGWSIWSDADGDWWLQPPNNVNIVSAPGEAELLDTPLNASEKEATVIAHKALQEIFEHNNFETEPAEEADKAEAVYANT